MSKNLNGNNMSDNKIKTPQFEPKKRKREQIKTACQSTDKKTPRLSSITAT